MSKVQPFADVCSLIGRQVQHGQLGALYRELSVRPQVLQVVVAEVELLELRENMCMCEENRVPTQRLV